MKKIIFLSLILLFSTFIYINAQNSGIHIIKGKVYHNNISQSGQINLLVELSQSEPYTVGPKTFLSTNGYSFTIPSPYPSEAIHSITVYGITSNGKHFAKKVYSINIYETIIDIYIEDEIIDQPIINWLDEQQ